MKKEYQYEYKVLMISDQTDETDDFTKNFCK